MASSSTMLLVNSCEHGDISEILDNHSDLKIKNDTRQYLQFLQCFRSTFDYTSQCDSHETNFGH